MIHAHTFDNRAREHTPAIITSHTGYKVYKPTPEGWLLGRGGVVAAATEVEARVGCQRRRRWQRRRKEMPEKVETEVERPRAEVGAEVDSQTWREDGMFGLSREPRGIRGTAGTENGAGR